MNILKPTRIVLSAFAISSTCIAAATEPTPQPRLASATGAADRMLDSIPPALFGKMFHNNKLVGSPGLAWKKQRVVTVAFYGGSDELYQLIEQTANEWT